MFHFDICQKKFFAAIKQCLFRLESNQVANRSVCILLFRCFRKLCWTEQVRFVLRANEWMFQRNLFAEGQGCECISDTHWYDIRIRTNANTHCTEPDASFFDWINKLHHIIFKIGCRECLFLIDLRIDSRRKKNASFTGFFYQHQSFKKSIERLVFLSGTKKVSVFPCAICLNKQTKTCLFDSQFYFWTRMTQAWFRDDAPWLFATIWE